MKSKNAYILAQRIVSGPSPIYRKDLAICKSSWNLLSAESGLIAQRIRRYVYVYHYGEITNAWAISVIKLGDPGSLSPRHLRSIAIQRGIFNEQRTVHGKTASAEYNAYYGMQSRCYNKNEPAYPDYGGRGITVSAEWRESFQNFFDDMGERPGPGHSLDRIDVNGNYCKENCRWATACEQARNTRKSVYAIINGERLTVGVWCRRLGIHPATVRNRMNRGMTREEALTTPLGPTSARTRRKAGVIA